MKRVIYVLLIAATALTTTYFDCGPPSSPPPSQGGGFNLRFLYMLPGDPTLYPDSDAYGTGQWQKDAYDAEGSVFSGPWSADAAGQAYVAGGRAPAYWIFTESFGACAGASTYQTLIPLQGSGVATFICNIVFIPLPFFTATPSSINTNNVPASVKITGSGLSSQYGMPRCLYYNPQDQLVGQETATSIDPNGTWVSGPTPDDLGSLQTGIYEGIVQNATAGGGWQTIGVSSITLYTKIPYGGCNPPPGGCTGGRYWDPDLCRCTFPTGRPSGSDAEGSRAASRVVRQGHRAAGAR